MRTEIEIEIEDDDEVEIFSPTPAWVSGSEGFETSAVPGTDLADAPKLEDLAKTIRECHAACQAIFQSSLLRAKEAGELLIRVKESLAHGEFGPWVDANCGFSPETARGYMRVARRWRELESADPDRERVTDLSYRAALAQLARPRSSTSGDQERSGDSADREHQSAADPGADVSEQNDPCRGRVIEIEIEDDDEDDEIEGCDTSTYSSQSTEVILQAGCTEDGTSEEEPAESTFGESNERMDVGSGRSAWDQQTLQERILAILRDLYVDRRSEWLAAAQSQNLGLETMAAAEITATILER
jgi:hypothetical protein